MSKVKKIIAKNIKGMEINQELEGREILLGENGVGKSAHMEALIIGMTGKLPGLGKTQEATFQVSSGNHLTVNLETNGGFSFGRTIRRKKTNHRDGTVSYKYTTSYSIFPDDGEDSQTDRLKRITREVGDFAIMFDMDRFNKMTDSEKRAFIFTLSSPEKCGWDESKIMEELAEAGVDDELFQKFWKFDGDPTVSVSEALSNIAKELLKAQAIYKSKAAAKAEIIELRQRLTHEAVSDIIEVQDKLKELHEKKSKLEREISSTEQVIRQRKSLNEEVSEIDSDLPRLEDLPEQSKGALEYCEKKLSHVKNAIESGDAAGKSHAERIRRIEKRLRALGNNVSNVEKEILVFDRRQQIKGTISAIKERGCPLMGDSCQSDLSGYADELQGEWDGIEKRLREHFRPKRDMAKCEVSDKEDELKTAEEEIANLMAAATALRREEKKEQKNVNNAKRELEKGQKEAEAAKGRRDTIQDILKKLPAISDVSISRQALSGVTLQINELDIQQKKAQEVKNVMANFDSANIAAADAEDLVGVLKNLREALGPGGLQKKIMHDVLGPIQDKINELLFEINPKYTLRFELYDMNGKETFEIITDTDTNEDIPYESLSGGQKILFGTAMMVAMVCIADPPIKALCIEAAELDVDNFMKLLSAIDEIGKDIDNIMVASCNGEILDRISKIDTSKWPWKLICL